ncbi:MAG: Lipoprotein-releasing system transmembrane protein LolE [Bacteroidetes bacterium ADurb.Bin408]|nr:MAG: Lipoprotein-releasing system transmembrane protein LolE [Bacteroidetes bacterium ADurb.Bin408]
MHFKISYIFADVNTFTLKLEYFVTQKITKAQSRGSFSKNAVLIAILSVALGLSVMIIAVAIVTGFQNEIAQKVIDFGAHIQINNFDNNLSLESKPINKNNESLEILKNNPEIKHTQVFALKYGIIKTENQIQGTVVKGIDKDFDWQNLEGKIIEGSSFNIEDSTSSNKTIISSTIANLLEIKKGDKIQIWFIQDPPRVRSLEVCGIYYTGLEEIDKVFIFADIKHIQKLNDWTPEQVSGIEVFVNDFKNVDYINNTIDSNIDFELQSRTIKEIYAPIFDWLSLLDVNAVVILVIMIFIACINMITTLLIIILDRTNMIGVLKAMGASNMSIGKIFFFFAFTILIRGLFWGNIISITLCLIQHYFGIITLPKESYFISEVPVNIDFFHILLLNIGTIICCLLIIILPALIVSRISPVNAIRYD